MISIDARRFPVLKEHIIAVEGRIFTFFWSQVALLAYELAFGEYGECRGLVIDSCRNAHRFGP